MGRGNQSKEVSPEVADDLTDAQREGPNDPPHDTIEIADSSDDDEVQSYLRDMSQEVKYSRTCVTYVRGRKCAQWRSL